MPIGSFNPAPKPVHGRSKPTAKQRGDISDKVRKAAHLRAGGRCEACGWVNGSYDPTGRRMGLQCAHLIRRRKVDGKTTVNDVAMLCGPSVNTGTCHNLLDYTRTGREWGVQHREYLYGRRTDMPLLGRRKP